MVSKADAVDHHEYLNMGLPTWHAQAGPHPAPGLVTNAQGSEVDTCPGKDPGYGFHLQA